MGNKNSVHRHTNWVNALFNTLLHEKFPQRYFTDNDLTKLMKKYVVKGNGKLYSRWKRKYNEK